MAEISRVTSDAPLAVVRANSGTLRALCVGASVVTLEDLTIGSC
jgi:hypothetical protein